MSVDKSNHVFCGHCGTRMIENEYSQTLYDRKTGHPSKTGFIAWECPKKRAWDSPSSRTLSELEAINPHDSQYLRSL